MKDIDWLIHLHPDVICRDRISKYPNAHLAGVSAGSHGPKSNNQFNKEINNFILKHNPNCELNGYGYCGGSIMYIPAFLQVYKSVIIDKKWDIVKLKDKYGDTYTRHEDVLFSLLFQLEGFTYRLWLDNCEENSRGYQGYTDAGAFEHGDKSHYNFKPGEDIKQYYQRVISENKIKQLKK